MSTRRWHWAAVLIAVVAAACSKNYNNGATGPAQTLGNPDSLTYLLLPGGPDLPNGVLLSWVPTTDPNVTNYVAFARNADTGQFGELGTTVSNSFHTAGTPLLQYYVASQDQFGNVSSGTSTIMVDTAPPLPPPDSLCAYGIDSGVKLHWAANARAAGPNLFAYYRVYSEMAQGSGTSASCPNVGADFAVEGSSVSEDFVVTGLGNGATWCYGVTTVTQDGHESVLSPFAQTTTNAAGGSFDAAPGTTIVVHHAGKGARTRTLARR